MQEAGGSRVRVAVSPEMDVHIGDGAAAPRAGLRDPIILCFALGEDGAPPVMTVATDGRASDATAVLVLAVERDACLRVFGYVPEGDLACHLPTELRLIAAVIRDCRLPEPWRSTHRAAKSVELLSAAFQHILEGDLVPLAGGGQLSAQDSERIATARRIIDERWREKLTLDAIARACGLNRAKLTRGFREMFACTVADALTDRRLGAARQLLLATDLPVSSVGYQCGYLNNASFTRAFARQYGTTPSALRLPRLAA